MPHRNLKSPLAFGTSSRREAELLEEIDGLTSELRAFVAVALQHCLRDYCEHRHPDIVRDLEAGVERSEERAEIKYAKVLAEICSVPGLQATRGETGERTYYRNAIDDVAYLEHALGNKRFILSGIWVTPSYRGQGIAHRILRRLVGAADKVNCGIALFHDPFGEQGLGKEQLEAFYNRHGFQLHETTPGGMFRFPRTPLDLYAKSGPNG
jgi:GNAT superfamily N-acetyltransferase